VVKQIYKENFVSEDYKKLIRDYLTANGRSYSQPILNEAGSIDRKKSRRVEFKFRLKDEQMIKELQRTLEE